MKPASDERTPDGGAYSTWPPDLEQLLAIRVNDRDDALILTVQGAIDGHTAPRLAAAIDAEFDRVNGRLLVVDLTAVEFMGSAGLRLLHEAAVEAVQHRGLDQLRVVVDHTRPVIRPIQLVGMDEYLALFETVDAALAAGDMQ